MEDNEREKNTSSEAAQPIAHGGVSISGEASLNVGRDVIGGNLNLINLGTGAEARQVAAGDNNVQIYIEAIPETASAQFSLKPPPHDFTGRQKEIALLKKQFLGGQSTAIVGIAGMGGVGKTTLALYVAQELQDNFPDGHIFVDMQGTSPNPTSAPEAMRQVIRAFDSRIRFDQLSDADLEHLYFSTLNGKRALMLLDNAKHAAQVRPLLPPTQCALIVTSRASLALPGLQGLRLELLDTRHSRILLQKLCEGLNDTVADEIAELCGRLPLALRIAGSYLSEHVDISPAYYLERLREQRLGLLKSPGDVQMDVEATFSLTYELLALVGVERPRFLPHFRKRNFQVFWRMLGVFPKPFTLEAAAFVWGLEREPAHSILSELVRVNAVNYDESAKCYELHDLMKEFARVRCSKSEMRTGVRRRVEFDKGVEEANLDWEPEDDPFWEWIFYRALSIDRKIRNYPEEMWHLMQFGNVYNLFHQPRSAIDCYTRSLYIARKIADQPGEAHNLGNLGHTYLELGEMRKAVEHSKPALAFHLKHTDREATLQVLQTLAKALSGLGNDEEAVQYYVDAIALQREIGDSHLPFDLIGLSKLYGRIRDRDKARANLDEALQIFQKQQLHSMVKDVEELLKNLE